jgi:cytosine/adenosine deaminase-related metal-dependent hydrolase
MNYHAHLDKGMIIPPLNYIDAPAPQKGAWTKEQKASFTVEDIKQRARLAIERSIDYGTAYVRTHVDVDPLVQLRGIEALLELQDAYANQIVIDIIAFSQEGFDRYPESYDLLQEALDMGVQGIGGHTTMDQDAKMHINRIFELGIKKDAYWIEFHTDETGNPDHFVLPYLAQKTKETGLGSRVTAIHCCSLANVEDAKAHEAIELVKDAGLTVTTCPTAIATRALTRVKDFLKAGIPIQLGSDNMGDFFNPFGSGNMLQYAFLLATVQRFYEDEEIGQLFNSLQVLPQQSQMTKRFDQLHYQYEYSYEELKSLIIHTPKPIKIKRD